MLDFLLYTKDIILEKCSGVCNHISHSIVKRKFGNNLEVPFQMTTYTNGFGK